MLLGRYKPGGSQARGDVWRKGGNSRRLLIIVKEEEICLSVRVLFLLSQSTLGVQYENKEVSVKPGRLGLDEETLWVLLLS